MLNWLMMRICIYTLWEILLTDNKIIRLNQKFKCFTDMLFSNIGENHLFFYTNLRSELINLFWLSKIDKIEKSIYLNVLGHEYNFKLTRSQYPSLKDFLKI